MRVRRRMGKQRVESERLRVKVKRSMGGRQGVDLTGKEGRE